MAAYSYRGRDSDGKHSTRFNRSGSTPTTKPTRPTTTTRTARRAAARIRQHGSGGESLSDSIRRTRAELAVRHQDLKNDKEIADTMARLAAKQQEARTAIAKNSIELKQLSALSPDQTTKENDARRLKAAN